MSKRSRRRRFLQEIPNHSKLGFYRNLRKSGFVGYVVEVQTPKRKNVLIPLHVADDLFRQAAELDAKKAALEPLLPEVRT